MEIEEGILKAGTNGPIFESKGHYSWASGNSGLNL